VADLRRRWIVLGAAGLLAGCRRRVPPELQIRLELDALEKAVEEKDFSRVKEGLSATFQGPEGMDRPGVMAMLMLRLRERPAPHLLVRVHEVTMVDARVGRAQLVVAMAALPITGPQALPKLEADLYRFELELVSEDGRFRIRTASWKPAQLDEFL
jgi:hypothetical protein